MKMIFKYLLYFTQIFILIQLVSCRNFAAGSYPDAQTYELSYSEETVINAIYNFKKKNYEYQVPIVTIKGASKVKLNDERTEDPDFWYKFYFYYEKENQVLFTWVRSKEEGKTIFAFVAVNDGLDIGNWMDINRDFDNKENLNQISKFEKRIFLNIKEELLKITN